MIKTIQKEAVHEYLNDLEEEYEARALLAKSKWFFKKGTQRFISAKATDQIECHKCGKKGHFTRDCWSKISVPSYQSPFQPKPFNSSQHKPELRPTKDFEAKYNKVKAKLALLSSSASASKATTVKNKGLIAKAYEWDEEEASSDDNEMVEVKVLMALAEENDAISKESARNGEMLKISMRTSHKVNQCISEQIPSQKKRILRVDQLTEDPSGSGQKDLSFLKSSAKMIQMSHIPGVERPWLSKDEGFILPNHDTSRILPAESQRNTTDPLIVVTNSSTPAKGNKSSPALKVPLAPAGKLKSVKIEDDPPLAIYDIRKPISYLDSGCSRHMTSVQSYLYKYVEQSGPNVVFGDDSTCTTECLWLYQILMRKEEQSSTLNKEIVIFSSSKRL
ncbi:retrovirus-related pol polyprotein from transposon TNT 1-94 [Tanacetum coccineum]